MGLSEQRIVEEPGPIEYISSHSVKKTFSPFDRDDVRNSVFLR